MGLSWCVQSACHLSKSKANDQNAHALALHLLTAFTSRCHQCNIHEKSRAVCSGAGINDTVAFLQRKFALGRMFIGMQLY